MPVPVPSLMAYGCAGNAFDGLWQYWYRYLRHVNVHIPSFRHRFDDTESSDVLSLTSNAETRINRNTYTYSAQRVIRQYADPTTAHEKCEAFLRPI